MVKIIALEEHLTTPALSAAWPVGPAGPTGEPPELRDVGEQRLADMDDQGVDVEVLSVTAPGLEVLPPAQAVALARDANDQIAAAVAAHPDRFQGFVNVPTPDPAGAVAELRRGVGELGFKAAFINGRVGDRNVDHPDLDPFWAAAAELHVPVYIHPQEPPRAVIDAYYSGFSPKVDFGFSHFGLGWHYETGIQLLHLIYGRVFDRYPDLQVVVGHWGEVVLFYVERIANLQYAFEPKLDRSIPEYLHENVYYTPSGIFSPRYLSWVKDLVGIERIMFSVDYPYVPTVGGGASRAFLENAALSDAEKEQIGHVNWEQLTAKVI